ncbi:MAG: hypothetical protein R3Y29_05815 [bacterium]
MIFINVLIDSLIKEYKILEEDIKREFKCDNDFFLKPMIGNSWAINTSNNTYFLTYLDQDNTQHTCYVVNKNSMPMIYKKDNLTMIIAIDCVKIAFIFENTNKL